MSQTAKKYQYTKEERRLFAVLLSAIILISIVVNLILHTL